MKTRSIFGVIAMVFALGILVLGGLTSPVWAGSKTLIAEPKALGQGTARSLVVLDNKGKPEAIGILLTKEVLSGLPGGTDPLEVMLKLPAKASVPPFKHLTVDWNPVGHEPPGIYDVPHLDLHFYMIPSATREKISAKDVALFAKAPPAEFLPVDYKQAPGGVPRMGTHWIDMTSPEFHGEPFTVTFIYGSYDGAVTFLEPMVSKAFLESAKEFSADIRQPSAFAKKGYYPTKYRITFDERKKEYRILLDGLTYR
jgi:hypothetical protein